MIVTYVLTSMSLYTWVLSGYPKVIHALCLENKPTNKNPEPETKDTEQRHEIGFQLHKAGPRLVEVVTRAVARVRALYNVK